MKNKSQGTFRTFTRVSFLLYSCVFFISMGCTRKTMVFGIREEIPFKPLESHAMGTFATTSSMLTNATNNPKTLFCFDFDGVIISNNLEKSLNSSAQYWSLTAKLKKEEKLTDEDTLQLDSLLAWRNKEHMSGLFNRILREGHHLAITSFNIYSGAIKYAIDKLIDSELSKKVYIVPNQDPSCISEIALPPVMQERLLRTDTQPLGPSQAGQLESVSKLQARPVLLKRQKRMHPQNEEKHLGGVGNGQARKKLSLDLAPYVALAQWSSPRTKVPYIKAAIRHFDLLASNEYKQHVVLIDDDKKNIESAKEFGIQTVEVQSNEKNYIDTIYDIIIRYKDKMLESPLRLRSKL
ncbi:MAG: hypothetical protein NQ127_04275 [Candidatus Cardinium sp.]|nr:hypothetical protein [Candidatus Cardinium sp.]